MFNLKQGWYLRCDRCNTAGTSDEENAYAAASEFADDGWVITPDWYQLCRECSRGPSGPVRRARRAAK